MEKDTSFLLAELMPVPGNTLHTVIGKPLSLYRKQDAPRFV